MARRSDGRGVIRPSAAKKSRKVHDMEDYQTILRRLADTIESGSPPWRTIVATLLDLASTIVRTNMKG